MHTHLLCVPVSLSPLKLSNQINSLPLNNTEVKDAILALVQDFIISKFPDGAQHCSLTHPSNLSLFLSLNPLPPSLSLAHILSLSVCVPMSPVAIFFFFGKLTSLFPPPYGPCLAHAFIECRGPCATEDTFITRPAREIIFGYNDTILETFNELIADLNKQLNNTHIPPLPALIQIQENNTRAIWTKPSEIYTGKVSWRGKLREEQ